MINGVVNNEMGELLGTKLTVTKQLGEHIDYSKIVGEKLSQSGKRDTVDFSHLKKQEANSFEVREYTLSSGEKVVEFASKNREPLQGESGQDIYERIARSIGEIQKGQQEFLQNELLKGNAQSFGEQFRLNKDYLNNAFDELRKNDLEAFSFYISRDDVLEGIVAGGKWELGDFTLDDWFDVKGEGWKYGIGDISDAAKEKIYNRARERGLL